MGKRRSDNGFEWALIGPVICEMETEKAILVKFENEMAWVPRSLTHPTENEIYHKGDTGMLVVLTWLAKQKGWL